MESLNLGISEYAVSHAIVELHKEHQFINAKLIAEHIGCEESTVYRAMKKLRLAGRLKRLDGCARHGGYRYSVKQ